MIKINYNLIKKIATVLLLFGFIGPIVALADGPATVNLGMAGNFAILAETAITTTGITAIIGDIGISPAAASYLTGFSQIMDTSNKFSSSSLVIGKIYAPNYIIPTPAYMTTTVNNMVTAYNDAAGRTLPATTTNLYGGLLSGHTFIPGLYKWTTGVSMNASIATTTDVTLSGDANDVWIFQISGDLTSADSGNIGNGAKIVLTGGAVASNIFWQVGGPTGATLGAYSTFKGTILSAKQIIFNTGAVIDGRALSQTQVTLIANSISIPTDHVAVTFVPPVTPAVSRTLHGTINVIKTVINDNGGTKIVSDFPLFVNDRLVVSGEVNSFFAFATYKITETSDSNYTQSFSGDCDANGILNLSQNENKVCIITNNDAGVPGVSSPALIPTSTSTLTSIPISSSIQAQIVRPLIHLIKKSNKSVLSAFGGIVTYTYTVTNPGTVPLSNVSVTDDKCSLPIYSPGSIFGDLNKNNLLESNETWIFNCQANIIQTTTNIGIAEGSANGLTAVDFSFATVVVNSPTLPDTGIMQDSNNITWCILILSGILTITFLLYLFRKNYLV